MNKSYLDDGRTIFVTNEYGDIEKRARTTSLEEVLIQENVVEEIQNQCNEINKTFDSKNSERRTSLNLFCFFTALFIGCLIFLLLSVFNLLSCMGGSILGTIISVVLDFSYFLEYKSDNKEVRILETLKYVFENRLIEEQKHLENLKSNSLIEEKEKKEFIAKKIDDTKQINQIRNVFLKLKEYLGKIKRLTHKKAFTQEEKDILTNEGINVDSLETYLLTFSKKRRNDTNQN